MRRSKSWFEAILENWPYLLALAPLSGEWLGHGGIFSDERALAAHVISGLLVLALVFAIRRKDQRLDEVAVTDKLTGLYNSRHLRAELDRQVALAHRAASPFCLLFLDVDNLKSVNDRFGHHAGDEVLFMLAQGLLGKIRAGMDLAFRFGGDEFVVLCPQTRLATARAIARRALGVPALFGTRLHGTTVSVAIAMLRERESPRELLRRADALLYAAKRAGKDRLVCEEPGAAAVSSPRIVAARR